MTSRSAIKSTVKLFFQVLILPFYIVYVTFTSVGNQDACFQSATQLLSLIPGKLGIYIRAAFLQLSTTNTSNNISVGFMTIFSHADTSIDENVYIGPQSNIGKCRIEKDCLIGSGVHILSGKNQHGFLDIETPMKDQKGTYSKITIGEDCWIGNNAVVMANLGKKTIVAAGSVVTQDIDGYSIVAGNPAKIIKSRK